MAGVRDPAFWRRFSMAVHLDEEAQSTIGSTSKPGLKHSDSWLARQQQKSSRRTCMCWVFWVGLILIVAAVVILVMWLKNSNIMK